MQRRCFVMAAISVAATVPFCARAQSAAKVYWVRRNDPPRGGNQLATWFAVDARTRAQRWLAHVAIGELRLTPLEEAYLRNDLSDGHFNVLGTIRPARMAQAPIMDPSGRPVTDILHVHRLQARAEGVTTTRLPLERGR
jgi:hypothetical protein